MSVAQEVELIDDTLMIKGHFDDLVLIGEAIDGHLVLYDYKTQNSRAFTWQKDKPISHFHRMQLGTYMYMLRKYHKPGATSLHIHPDVRKKINNLHEARILKISKDDLRMSEDQLMWTPDLERDVFTYWSTLNGYWKSKTIPSCTCADYENGFMAKEAYNPFWFDGEPCSLKWYELNKKEK